MISLYSYEEYLSASQTLNLYDWGSDDTNMHSYSQGKYIQSMFTENKTNGDSIFEKATKSVASYAVT